MSNVNTVNVPTAIESMNRLNLSFEHITTTDFMRLQPVGYRHMPKKEHFVVDVSAKVNPTPIQLPIYGKIKQNVRAFWVPYRLVFPHWDKFYNDTLASNFTNTSLVGSTPFMTVGDIVTAFLTNAAGVYRYVSFVTDPTAIANEEYDIQINGNYCIFNARGRQCYSFLLSLGYCMWGDNKNSFQFNCLALLAAAKVYIDWYANPQYLNSQEVIRIEQLLSYNDPATPLQLSPTDIVLLMEFCTVVNYDCDEFFNYAYDKAMTPNNSLFTNLAWTDPSTVSVGSNQNLYTVRIGTVNDTPAMLQNSSTQSNVGTETAHQFLRRITEFQKRHQLAGARSIDRALLQYGVISDALKIQRSIYCGNFSNEVKIGNLYATANGSNGVTDSTVGDFAGVGFGQGSHSWEFKSDEEGIFLVFQSIVPSGGFYQGYDRNNRHLLKTDFYVPELDSSVQLIEKGEVYVSKNQGFVSANTDYDSGFGFIGKYAEQKFPRNFLTGDLRFFSGGNFGDAWHLLRKLEDSMFTDTDGLVHSRDFARGVDRRKYDRVFQYTGDDFDHFICEFYFNAHAYTPLKPAFETFDFDSDKNKVSLQTNGTLVN